MAVLSPNPTNQSKKQANWKMEFLQKMKSLVLFLLLAVMVVGEEGESIDLARCCYAQHQR